VAALVAAGQLDPKAYAMHMLAITMTNDQLSDLETVTLKDLAKTSGWCVRTVSRRRRKLKDAGVEEHEQRSHRRPNGTFLGRPNQIRFHLPEENAARVAARAEAGRRKHATARQKRTTPKKDRPTPKAPQNQPDGAERALQAGQAIGARHDARATGRACPVCDGACVVETPDGYVPCDACDRTGILGDSSPHGPGP